MTATFSSATDLGALLDLAAGLYLREPTPERLALCQELGGELRQLLDDLALGELFAAAAGEEPAEVRQEFFDLLLVSFGERFCAPFAGVHGGDRETGPAVAACYRATGFSLAGLDLPPYLRGIERCDHIGFELAFLAGLLLSAAEAHGEEQAGLLATAHRFHREHGGWMGDFGRLVESRAQTSFFKAAGLLTTKLNGFLDLFFLSSHPLVPAELPLREARPLR